MERDAKQGSGTADGIFRSLLGKIFQAGQRARNLLYFVEDQQSRLRLDPFPVHRSKIVQ